MSTALTFAFRVPLGLGRHGNFEIAHVAQAGHQIRRIHEPTRMRRIARTDTTLRVATQRNEMANTGSPELLNDRTHLFAGRTDAGQMRSGREWRVAIRRLTVESVGSRVVPPAP